MSRTKAQTTRDNRLKREHALIERLAIEAGYTVAGNDKSGIDELLDDVEKEVKIINVDDAYTEPA